MYSVVERDLEIDLVLSPEHRVPVPARLHYRAEDPYAVRISFHVTSDEPVNWTFGRELLTEGLRRACGTGDVRVWPARSGGRSVVCVGLTSPDGDALLQAPAEEVAGWLAGTLRLVPLGAERERLGLDEGLRELLAQGA
ncbi:SsgA family sporulation/cell division regulator [Streptomyces mobaraensis NBRC 13819 = DSM 40847]|uniref:SsgA family sporulation/cell division regulator n=2 Tax=Streptomyces mobaraensis TaxID=35621 RepID=A0A5N5WCH9_STRMB|nr:SsgA family sporulation/cell division regulator [Streptomyces mobaraensis]EME97757.1 SsgG protein [Streptomyces mobaraensis NBRC 13819 = DSM 40847]KAB7849874.1 SsgA family sporulation/cell division regulator [Streptomyces mobaraensis]QTT74015.1 SsgA family sporulation/cell division regulator [Streptomyces mobaraensis NBRC 13819 = DSM 40847]